MAKNKTSLLKESAVRRFMKLAELNGLSDHFVSQNYIAEEEEVEMDISGDDAPPADVDMDDEAVDMDDEAVDMDDEPEAEITPEEAKLLVSMGDRLKASGITGDEDMGDEAVDMDDEAVDMDDEEEDDVQLESLGVEILDDTVIKEALYKRVVQRLAATSQDRKLAESKKKKVANQDALVERILARVTGESK
jgi:hypothetical protein